MSCFKFDRIKVATKDFHKKKQLTDIFTIDVNKIVVSDRVQCNNREDWQYTVGYQVDGETIIPLFIKTPKNIFSYVVSQYKKSWACTVLFDVPEVSNWVHCYQNIWNKVASE